MYLNECSQWLADIDETIAALPMLEKLVGSSILITGSTGLICSAVIDLLIRWNETQEGKIGIYSTGRDIQKIKARFFPYSEKDYFSLVEFDATKTPYFNFAADYIIHGASNASPKSIVTEPVETMLCNFMGLKYLLDYAKKNLVKRLLFISTSEVYGKTMNDKPLQIDNYGGIDILNPRNSYSIGKCAAETLCVSYYYEYDVDSVIIRPGHIYGPTAHESDNRVSSAWAYAAARGADIVIKSDGYQIRSYCYCLDCASAILASLINGESIHAYNISNPESVISIKDMAEILTKSANVKLRMELPTEEDKRGFNPMKNSSLDGSELQRLGWHPIFDAERGFSHTVEIIKEFQKQ